MILQGNGVSEGVAVGSLFVYAPQVLHARQTQATPGAQAAELGAYEAARAQARKELVALRERLAVEKEEHAAIFDAHLDLVDDEVIVQEICDALRGEAYTAAAAVEAVYGRYAQVLAGLGDERMAQRAADLIDVAQRLLRALYGMPQQELAALPGPVILVANDLLPSETASIDRANLLGIAVQRGGATSHSAIIARGWGIPAVVGIPGLLEQVQTGETAVLDAQTGTLETEPQPAALYAARKKRLACRQSAALDEQFAEKRACTRDGVEIDIGLNLDGVNTGELESARFTDFAGLLRTEFLYMNSDHMPTEEEQYAAYKKVLLKYGGRPVTLRTLDIGGDKTLPYFPLPREENPFLGLRALRLCFEHPDILHTQLRAALRASLYGELWVMLPMVSGVEDFRRARALFQKERAELAAAGVPMGARVKLGVMIETPAMVLMADKIAAEADFASVGTNDLCQYLTAADRMNPTVASYCRSSHPALYRAVSLTVQAFRAQKKPVCVCGELAADEQAACVLVGLGLRKLSMGPAGVGRVKRVLSLYTLEQLERLARDVQGCADADEVLQCIKNGLAVP